MYRMFIKTGAKDKLDNLDGTGGFATIEVMVTGDFERTVPDWEKPNWLEVTFAEKSPSGGNR